jgi:hypothetical protein
MILEKEIAVALPLGGNFFLMVDAGTFDGPVFFFVAASEPARAVWPAEPGFVPDQSPNHRAQLLFIVIDTETCFLGIGMDPLQHICFF